MPSVGPRTAIATIVAWSPVQPVPSVTAEQAIRPAASLQRVGAIGAVQHVGTSTRAQRVAARGSADGTNEYHTDAARKPQPKSFTLGSASSSVASDVSRRSVNGSGSVTAIA